MLKQAFTFHDSVLKGLNYTSGAYVDSNSMHLADDIRQVTMYFDSQWCEPIELIFEGVTALNLRPAEDNYMADIFGASLYAQNSSVFFCDGFLDNPDTAYTGTWITAYSLDGVLDDKIRMMKSEIAMIRKILNSTLPGSKHLRQGDEWSTSDKMLTTFLDFPATFVIHSPSGNGKEEYKHAFPKNHICLHVSVVDDHDMAGLLAKARGGVQDEPKD